MKRIFTLTVLFAVLATTKLNAQITYTNNGTSTNYTLNAGDSLSIASGTYTGKVVTNTGSKIVVQTGATFQPNTFNNVSASFENYGTVKIAMNLKTTAGFGLINYGNFWVTGTTDLTGATAQTWINIFGSQLKLDGDVSFLGNHTLSNRGTATLGANVIMSSGGAISNRYSMSIAGTLLAKSGAYILNEAFFQTGGIVTLQAGSVVTNNCRFVAGGDMTTASTSFTNSGLVWAKANAGAGKITNTGTITNSSLGRVKAVNFTNSGTVNGAGYLYFTGVTSNAGTVGVAGYTLDTVQINDITKAPTTIFDTESGVINPNAVYRTFAAPDTINNFGSCSVEIISNIPLPVKWNYFFVNLTNSVPVLSWSADQDPGTMYEIERSYDGKNFSTIKYILTETNESAFTQNDNTVNTSAAVVYYRIKATEPNNNVKYSETRTVKFSNKAGVTIQAVPNPFTSQFSINYQSTDKGMIAVKVYSLNGQLQTSKSVTVNNGYNSITVTEASKLPTGMYLVQVSKNNQVIASEKLIKQ
jgi:hypothetical protein